MTALRRVGGIVVVAFFFEERNRTEIVLSSPKLEILVRAPAG